MMGALFNRYGLTIFDCANKFVAFSSSILSPEPIRVTANEWGSLFLLTSDGTFWQLKEKDLQTKMTVFYKKNHYDLAVKVLETALSICFLRLMMMFSLTLCVCL